MSVQHRTRESQKGKIVSEIGSTSDKESQKSKVVSEVEPTLDKAKSKERGCVRSRANIGQGQAKRARLCPKSSRHWTRASQKSEVVSEVEPTSDKEEPKERGCVRSRTNFRQGRAKRGEIVSEVETTSDKGKPKKCDDVRRNPK